MSSSKIDSDYVRDPAESLGDAERGLESVQDQATETTSRSDADSTQNKQDGDRHESEKKENSEELEEAGDDIIQSTPPVPLSSYTLKKLPWRLQVTDFQAIMDHKYRGAGTAEDPFLVTWLDTDPENPKQWSTLKHWTILFLSSMLSLCVALASSAYTGALPQVMEQFHCSEEVALLGLSLMMIGYAVGPLVWAPLAESFGRRVVLFPTLFAYTLWSSVCVAAQNIESLLVFRLLAGLFGASTMVIPGGIIADVFPAETRGAALTIFTATPFLGPSLGPIVGGFLVEAAGWRWVMALLAIFAAVVTITGVIFIPETYGPVLLRTRAKKLSEVSGKVYLTAMDAERQFDIHQLFMQSLVRPWILLFREPIVTILTLYVSVVYGTLYLCFPAYPIVFQQGRGWSEGIGSLAFLGVFLGMMIGVVTGAWDNRRYKKLHILHGGFAPPESRLPPVIFAGVLVIVGLAWFAATDSPNIHWASSICAGIPFGMGFVLIVVCTTNYLIDSYVIYASSVLAAGSVLRSAFGCVFPLFTKAMYQNLGIHWAAAIPGFISLACFPFPILFYIYGPKIRSKCKYAAEAAKILDMMKSNLERQRTREPDERKESIVSIGMTISDEPRSSRDLERMQSGR